MEFNHALAVFQHLLTIDEDKMLENLATCISPEHAFYPEVLTYIQAHYKNSQHTSFSDLISQQANTLVNDEVIHQLIDTQIGYYKLTKKLGQGGMGAVYLGERNDGQLEQKVAIKFVYPSIVALAGEKFLQLEAQHLANVNHKNITKIYTIDTTQSGLPFMVMEYVEGIAIDQYCTLHNLSLPKRIRLFQKVCYAVHAAHQNLIIHADLKPSNILIDNQGEPKLMDFGIATRLENITQTKSNQDAASKTKLHAVSYHYASPEQIAGDVLTVTSDIYSAAKVLETLIAELLKQLNTQTLWYQQTLAQCFEPIPLNRIASFDELAKGLDKISRYQAPDWIKPSLWQNMNSFVMRNTTLSIVSSLFALIIFVFVLKLMAKNKVLIEQNDSNQKVISFLSQLFGKEGKNTQSDSVFGLLSQDKHHALATATIDDLSKQSNKVFSPFIFANHSAKVGEPILLPLTLKDNIPMNYTLSLSGQGKVTKNGEFQHTFTDVGVHNVKVVAQHGQNSEVLALTFIVRDDQQMPFSFSDIDEQDRDYAELHYLALKGIVIGRPGKRASERIFSPDTPVKQAEALKLLMMAAHNRQIIQLKKSTINYENLVIVNAKQGVEDFSWAATFLDAAFELGLLTNQHNFDPKLPASKQWVAHVLVHTLQLFDPQHLTDNHTRRFTDTEAFANKQYANSANITAFYNLLGQYDVAFEPNKPLTRREVALIATKILRLPVIQQTSNDNKFSAPTNAATNQIKPQLPDLQTPSYKRVGNTIIALEQNDPSFTSIELKQNAKNELVMILTNTENNVSNAISVPYDILH